MKITNEFKTGMLIVAAILAGVIFYVKTTDFTAKPYKLKTTFNYAEGIKADSIVKLAGIDVGRVEKIEFKYVPETKVELDVLHLAHSAIKAGAKGVDMGRNVWQSKNPVGVIKALGSIVHGGASVKEASAMLKN